MFYTKLVALLCVAILAANAQDSSTPSATDSSSGTTPTVSDCLNNCFTQSLSGSSCSSVDDIQCLCSDVTFQAAAASCVTTNCPDQVQSALQLQQQQCAAVSGASSGSTGSTATGAASSGTNTASGPTSSGTSPTTSRSIASPSTASTSGASASDTNNAAAPVALVSGPGASLAVIVSLAGAVAGAFIL